MEKEQRIFSCDLNDTNLFNCIEINLNVFMHSLKYSEILKCIHENAKVFKFNQEYGTNEMIRDIHLECRNFILGSMDTNFQ